jgi:hypothetical protein
VRLPAGDEVEPLVQLRQQARNLGRVVLQIGVDRDEHVSLGMREARGERGGFAEVAPQPHHANVPLRAVQSRERRPGAVGRAVVHEHCLPGLVERLQCCLQLLVEKRDRLLFVVNRDDDGDHGA